MNALFNRDYDRGHYSAAAALQSLGYNTERVSPYTQADEFTKIIEFAKIIDIAEMCNVEKTPKLFNEVFNRLYPAQVTAGENFSTIIESIKPLGEKLINKLEEINENRKEEMSKDVEKEKCELNPKNIF